MFFGEDSELEEDEDTTVGDEDIVPIHSSALYHDPDMGIEASGEAVFCAFPHKFFWNHMDEERGWGDGWLH
ncbi:unnamed protein product [Linum trigynum]|uniref:Uncharacterized protein n=1 Tax=Linum trigynum TaxID=586398 RepID=A0AAV2GSJ3_9ROSI